MTTLATAFIDIRPDTSGFGARLSTSVRGEADRAGRTAGQRFGGAMKNALKLGGVMAGAFAATRGVDFLKDSIGAASDLGETMSKVGVVFGKGAGDVNRFASNAAKALGQSKQAALDAAATFGTMGKVAGLTGRENAKFSTTFTKLASDMASFGNTTPEEAVEALGSALRGEAEPIRKYGVLLDDSTLRNEAMRLGLIKTTKEALTPQQKVLAAQAAIMKQTSDAQGDFGRTSDGLANQQRILSAQFEDVKTEVGEKLLPIVLKFVSFINDRALPAVTKFGGWLQDNVVPALKSTGEWIGKNSDWLLPLVAGIGAGVAVIKTISVVTRTWAAAQALLNLALTANPVGIVVVAIGALVAAFVVAYKKSETFRNVVNSTWETVKTATQLGALWVADKVLWMAEKMLAAMVAAFGWAPKIGPKLRAAADEVAAFRESVNNEMDKIRDETVNVTVRGVTTTAGNIGDLGADRSAELRRARGGPIPLLPGSTPGKDSVRVLAMPGEHYLTADEVKKAGGHRAIESIRAGIRAGIFRRMGDVGWDPGRRGRGGVQALAQGGPVFDVSTSRPPLGGIAAMRDALGRQQAEVMRRRLQAAAAAALRAAAMGGNPLPGGGKLTPAQIARGQAFARREAGKPYIWGGVGPAGYDCSGFVSAVLNAALGVGPYFRRGSTGTMPWAGSSPGTGSFTYGFFKGNPGHTAGNIGGLAFESTNGSTRVGGAARSATSFPSVYHYDRGGLASGVGSLEKRTLRPERVLSPRQTDAFERLVARLDESGPGWSDRDRDAFAAAFYRAARDGIAERNTSAYARVRVGS